MHAPAGKICDTCGSSLDSEAPSGFCPACLLSTALDCGEEDVNAAGASIADYEILSELARGGMGIVYRARQRNPPRIVALKMILPAYISSAGAIARFRAEAEAAASLDHAGILPVYAVGEKDGAPFYSMKFAQGGSLATRLAAFRDKPRESADLIAKLARATAHAHERGILHRDLKPGNVLFDATDKPFVSDFGLAKWLERECDLTQTLAILGTPHYMAPEQTADSHSITPAADIYSLGAILFHLLTERVPFRGENALDVLRQAAERPAPRPRVLNHKVPADLETICLKCLEKEPAARYSSATALADDLDRFLARRPILARRANPVTQASRWARRNPWVAFLGAASMALLVSLLLVLRPAIGPRAPESQKSIAVLPFEDLGPDSTNDFFANGMHDDVLVSLSKIADLKVVSRNSVMQYRGLGRDLREIGRALGVQAFVEGTIRRDGTRARINVQLIKAADGSQIWAENYDREIKDAFAIQSEVALRIASVLRARLSSLETARLQAAPTKSSQAYLRFIEAKNLYGDYRKLQPDLDKAERLYQEAIGLDPGFALAHAGLSQLYNIYYELYDTTTARREKARAAAREALRLQPDLPEGHLALAFDYWRPNANTGEIDYENALAEFSIAQRGLPNDAEIYSSIGQVERHQGKWAESTANLKKAVSLDPNSVERWHRLFYNYELTRNYGSAAAALERTIALAPPEDRWTYEWHRSFLNFFQKCDVGEIERVPPPPNSVGRSHTEEMFGFKMLLRKYDEAEQILLGDQRDVLFWGNTQHGAPKSLLLGRLYARSGKQAEARAQFEAARVFLEQATAARPRDADAHINLAEAYAGLDRKNDAIREARRATEIIPESKDPWFGADELSKLAQIYVMVGEFDLALPIIEHCLSTVSPIYRSQLRFQPAWDPVRNDPRFQELIARPDVVIPVGELETPPK
jgi:serine/threonine protein kinase/tetratricopeptide (TPR) repeat protein